MILSLPNILKEKYSVSDDDLNESVKVKFDKGISLGEALVQKKIITETQLLEALGIVYNLPVLPELLFEEINSDFLGQVPKHYLKKYCMVPLVNKHEDNLGDEFPEQSEDSGSDLKKVKENIVALNNPLYFQQLDDLVKMLNMDDYKVVLSTKDSIYSVINILYDFSNGSAEQLVQDMEENNTTIISGIEDTADIMDNSSDAPIIKLVNHILSQSIKARASDVHIEPYQNSLKVRYRIDGVLYDLVTPPKWVQAALISRIKVMAKMNIAEKRLPQDGRIEVKVGDQNVDVRISTIPTSFGERVVLRLLNKSGQMLSLSELGLNQDQLGLIENIVRFPNGIILVTGPTGSGKTTSLYSILSSLNNPDINIITIEDPVEYQLHGISQIQVNTKIGLTFAKGLRSIVRQDPDIILVGEIRDQETAEIAVQSALTGHLVFSTLHTNDSASAITRLVNIGIEPFLISSSIVAVVAQRLIRVLCPDCKESYKPDSLEIQGFGNDQNLFRKSNIYRSKGCEKCLLTGYTGRIGIFEIMVMDNMLKSLILKSFDSTKILDEAMKQGLQTLKQDGIRKILDGVTSIEEILRVTHK